MMIRSSAAVAVLVGVVAALPGGAGAATPYSFPSGRPHSRVVTYDRGTVRVETLQAAVTRSGGHLEVAATIKVKNLTARRVTRFVRAGRCVSGTLPAPACKADALFSFSIAGGGEATVVRRFALRQPPSKVDAIELAVQASRRAPAYFSKTDGELLLRGNAWRGVGAGAVYGVTFPAGDDRAKRLSFDLPGGAAKNAYADVIWTGTSAPAAPTTLGKCNGADCLTAPLSPARFRTGGQRFGNRFDLNNAGHAAITLGVTDTDGTPLLTAALPWPMAV